MLRTLAAKRYGRVLAAILAGVIILGGASFEWYRWRNVRVPLLTIAVGVQADGSLIGIAPGQPADFFSDSRVLTSTQPAAVELASQQRVWLASGHVPGRGGAYQEMAETALLDMHSLIRPDGGVMAAWPAKWRYVWPRDAAFIAVALARTGHVTDALSVLRFLQNLPTNDGVFQARYLLDGSGPPNARGEQSDSCGWVMWALSQVLNQLAPAQRTEALAVFQPMIDLETAALIRLTSSPDALPPPSPDSWEVQDDQLSLGTAGPMAIGLQAASELATARGDVQQATLTRARLLVLNRSIVKTFGEQGFPRYADGGGSDASVAFLLPPFVAKADPATVAAWRRAMAGMHRPAGGLAPGEDWKHDGISWTPATSLFAWTAASLGDRQTASRLLTWLQDHRTTAASLPEKVLSNGQPAGPAPLAWTDAVTLLAISALDASA